MRRLLLASALLLLAGCSSAATDPGKTGSEGLVQSTGGARKLVTLALDDYPTQMRYLSEHGYDVAGVDVRAHQVDVVVSEEGLALLKSQGMSVVREKDATRAGLTEATAQAYQTETTLATALHAYAQQNPTLAAVVSIGKSLEGRDIWAIKITKNVSTHSATKPVILFNGMHHAREVMATEVPLDTIDYLLGNYGKLANVTHWIDSNEIWIVPMLNPDGNNKVWTEDSFWRKNTRGCGAGTCPSGTGVDINRNYPWGWASCSGSSTDPSADDYHGPSAASEPETHVLMALVARTRPVIDVSYHSYSELVLYPQGCDNVFAPTQAILSDLGSKVAAALPSDDGTGTYTAGTPWQLLYAVDGDDIDWMYHIYNVVPFVIELNSPSQGFQPSFVPWRDQTVQKLRTGWAMFLDRLDQSGVRGVVTDSTGAVIPGTIVNIASSTVGVVTQQRKTNPDGSFHIVLLPGTYHVKITAPGHTGFLEDVTVGQSRVDLTVHL